MKNEKINVRRNYLINSYQKWEKTTIFQRFEIIKEKYPKHPFIIDSRIHTYQEVGAETEHMISCLKEQGIQKDDYVIVALGNRVEFLYITFALAAIGAIKVPVNQNIGITEIQYIVEQTSPKLLFMEKIKFPEGLKKRIGNVKVICFEDQKEKDNQILNWKTFYDSRCNCQEDWKEQSIEIDPDSICDVIYTSGSTGNPRGALLTHDMLLRNAYANCLNRGICQGWRCYIPLPLFHVYGYVDGLLAVLLVGGSIVITGGKFNPEKAIFAMEYWEADDILSVPFIMAGILRSNLLNYYHLTSLKAVYCSASICPDWIWEKIRRKLGVEEITTGYGMTEVCGATIQTDPYDSNRILSRYVGKILDGGCAGSSGKIVLYRIVDPETGVERMPGQPGELLCKGSVVTKGYLKETGEQQEVFDCDGWFHTGDIGCFTEDGYLELKGRMSDSYRINGENVSPQFLDSVISKCPDVVMVETVGVPDEKLGYVGAAFIESTSLEKDVIEKIKNYCREELASYQVPAYFIFENSENWPKTPSGKIKKYRLQQIAIEKIKHIKMDKI